MELEKVIEERFLVRKFSKKLVEKDKLDKILHYGNLAPTAKNIQPQRIYVVESPEGLEKIDRISRCRYNAPIVLIVCSDLNEVYKDEFGDTADIDESIVLTHIMLEAYNLGVDSVWVDLFDHIKIKEEFNIPEEYKPVAIMPLGYREENVVPSSMHTTKKDINEIVTYIKVTI